MLPIGVTTKYASINCFSGTVSEQTMAEARKLACNMKAMFAMAHGAKGRKQDVASGWMKMHDGSVMPASGVS